MRSALTVLFLFAAAANALAGDYIRLGVDSIPAWSLNAEIPFYAERTCPQPELIMGTANGFVLNATGDVTWEFVEWLPQPDVCSWFLLSFLFINGFDDVSPDTFLTSGASMPPSGMPVFEDRLFFRIILNFGGGAGALCIDSAFVFSAGRWRWAALTCGIGGGPDRPLFVDKYGGDDQHPVCIEIYSEYPPPDDHIRFAVDSLAAGTIRAELPFYVSRTCPVPNVVEHISNGFILTATGDASWSFSDYSVGPLVDDWFPIAGQLVNLIDSSPPDSFLVWSSAASPYGLPHTEEELLFMLYLDIGPGLGEICIDSGSVLPTNSWYFRGLSCGQGGSRERPLFLAKDSSNTEHPIRVKIYESMCGDLNLDAGVDIDDIVYLLEYVFGGEPMSIVIGKADVDCSGAVDVDDIVHLLDYVFGTGPEPCAGCQ